MPYGTKPPLSELDPPPLSLELPCESLAVLVVVVSSPPVVDASALVSDGIVVVGDVVVSSVVVVVGSLVVDAEVLAVVFVEAVVLGPSPPSLPLDSSVPAELLPVCKPPESNPHAAITAIRTTNGKPGRRNMPTMLSPARPPRQRRGFVTIPTWSDF